MEIDSSPCSCRYFSIDPLVVLCWSRFGGLEFDSKNDSGGFLRTL